MPFRLDQYLALAKESSGRGLNANTETFTRAKDPHFWAWMWNCFRTRRTFSGPTHFIRVSTPVDASGLAAGDQLLQAFLQSFLLPVEAESGKRNLSIRNAEDRWCAANDVASGFQISAFPLGPVNFFLQVFCAASCVWVQLDAAPCISPHPGVVPPCGLIRIHVLWFLRNGSSPIA